MSNHISSIITKRPLLSIVIPTKDRYYYLEHLIKLILSFNSQDVEIVIQDNTYDNAKFIRSSYIKNKTIKYFHTKEPIPISLNSDKAILNSTGEYVCFLGDDDGVTSEIINQVRLLKHQGIQAMISRSAIYNWPDYKDDSLFNLSSTLLISNSGKNDFILFSKQELKKVQDRGFDNMGLLPRVYQGVVHREALEKVYKKCGTFFPGPSPDMANAIALAGIIEKYLFSNKVTIITGQSKCVGGGERLLSKLKRFNETEHLPKDIMNYWDKKIPSFWCSDTIWPGSAIIAAERMDLAIKINYNKIYGRFLFNHPLYASTLKEINVYSLKVVLYKYFIFFAKIKKWLKNRLSFYFSNKKRIGNSIVYRNIRNTLQAAELISRLSK